MTITENGNFPNTLVRGMYRLAAEPDQTLKEHLQRMKTEAEKRAAN